jgi:hypothetical protein
MKIACLLSVWLISSAHSLDIEGSYFWGYLSESFFSPLLFLFLLILTDLFLIIDNFVVMFILKLRIYSIYSRSTSLITHFQHLTLNLQGRMPRGPFFINENATWNFMVFWRAQVNIFISNIKYFYWKQH